MQPDPTSTSSKPVHFLLTVIAVLGAAVMLFVFLDRNGFWIDELYTLHSIRLGWKDMVSERMHRGHFPGYFAMVRLWYGLWPEQMFETALRSMSAMFYLLAVASFWLLARRVLSSPASLVAIALFACNGIALRQASEARMYTVVLFFAVWITRCWHELQNPGAPRRWAVAMPLLSLLAFAVSPTVGILVGGMLISYFARQENRTAFYTTLISMACGLAVFIPGAILHVQTARRLGISSSKPMVFLAHPIALMPGVQIWDDYYNSTIPLMVLLTIALPVTAFTVWRLWKKRHQMSPPMRRMGVIVALPLVVITLAYPLIEIFELDIMGPARYFITLLPCAAMLGAWALMSWPRRRVAVHAALTVFLLLNAWAILTVTTEKFRTRMHDSLSANYRPGDGLVVTAHEIEDGVELYVPGAKVDEAVSRWITDHDEIRSRLEPLSNRETVWLVWYHGNDSPIIEVAEEMWGPFESNKPEDPYGGLRIYRFNPIPEKP